MELEPWEWVLIIGLLSLSLKIWSMWRYSRRVDTDPALVVPIGLRTRVVLQSEASASTDVESEHAPFLADTRTASGHALSSAATGAVPDVPPRYIDCDAVVASSQAPAYTSAGHSAADPPPQYSIA
eukprot:m.193155 g.193155  ORF g.193155 m.193155 type:complete len:126 (+) comp15177_c0_seq4:88-465(+)